MSKEPSDPEKLDVDDLFSFDDESEPKAESGSVDHPEPESESQSLIDSDRYWQTKPKNYHVDQVEPSPHYSEAPAERPQASLLTYAAIAVAIFFAVLYFGGMKSCERSDDREDTTIEVRVDKPHVLITSGGNPTDGQGIVLSTTKVQTWCEQNGIEYRKFADGGDDSALEPAFQALLKVAASPPAMTMANTRTERTASRSRSPRCMPP
ncbi:hypothetical protein FF011L_47260 [Roseimaritima multifibrata]|uniref:Uncharacterized protein n=1 Tax=Roseimaritima multifibrata TaxID=1930274 RepID=A0A517MM07_9BACT|nr:hypothetical protein [Roseimaritima multifibrata]QDS95925.1 hypothetical protein FF011L_47260 [Roseimaritima multifibrata]